MSTSPTPAAPAATPAALLTAVLAAVLAMVLTIGLVAAAGPAQARPTPSPAAEPAAPPVGPAVGAPLAMRGDVPGVDAPVMPKGCFGPARTGIDPFPCPLNTHRKGRPVVVLWGDSHAYMYIPALKRAARSAKVNLVGFVAGSCPPALVTGKNAPGACRQSNYAALRYVRSLVREKATFKVVVGSNWSGFRRAYRQVFLEDSTGVPSGYSAFTKDMIRLAHQGTPRLFDRLARWGVDVDLVAQAPVVPATRPACRAGNEPYNCDLPRWRAIPEERKTRSYVRAQQAKIQQRGRSRIIDTTPGYCTATVCHGRIGTIETYFDDLHLSATRTRNLGRFFKPALRDVLR